MRQLEKVVWIVATGVALFMGDTLVAQRAARPRIPFEDPGGCPFEGCQYGEWTTRAPVPVRADRRDNAPVVFTLAAGEPVTAVDGVVVTTRLGIVRFSRADEIETDFDDWTRGALHLNAGETLYLLHSIGEGWYRAWFDGVVRDIDMSSVMGNITCETTPAACAGRVIQKGQYQWWVQIRNRQGQLGWSRETEKFDGKDRFG